MWNLHFISIKCIFYVKKKNKSSLQTFQLNLLYLSFKRSPFTRVGPQSHQRQGDHWWDDRGSHPSTETWPPKAHILLPGFCMGPPYPQVFLLYIHLLLLLLLSALLSSKESWMHCCQIFNPPSSHPHFLFKFFSEAFFKNHLPSSPLSGPQFHCARRQNSLLKWGQVHSFHRPPLMAAWPTRTLYALWNTGPPPFV